MDGNEIFIFPLIFSLMSLKLLNGLPLNRAAADSRCVYATV